MRRVLLPSLLPAATVEALNAAIDAAATDALAAFSEATKEALRVLQQEMAELHRTFQAAYPGRKGFAMSGTPRASCGAASKILKFLLRCSSSSRMAATLPQR